MGVPWCDAGASVEICSDRPLAAGVVRDALEVRGHDVVVTDEPSGTEVDARIIDQHISWRICTGDVDVAATGIDDLVSLLEQGSARTVERARRSRPDRGSAAAAWSLRSLGSFLTRREREVLVGLVHGDSTAALAQRLGVRPSTVRAHVQSVLSKLCVHSRVEAVVFALDHGLVSYDDSSR